MDTINHSSSDVIPQLYARWIAQVLQGPIPEEKVATCSSCAMCPSVDGKPEKNDYYFNPSIKCCTYIPELPNFLVGTILNDQNSENTAGRDTVRQRIATGVGVTPLGLFAPTSYTLIYRNSPAAFGRANSLRCPHYVAQTGQCAIWRHRAPPCISWYCKHNRGAVGRAFWRELYSFLLAVQHNISLWCLHNLDIDVDALHAMLDLVQRSDVETNISGEILDGQADKKSLHTFWGSWYGREAEFYQRCASLIETLDWNEILAICGPEVPLRARLLQTAYQKLVTHNVPSRVRAGNFQVVRVDEQYVKITTYSPYDPLDIPRQVLDALTYFDGRPLSDALDVITREKNLSMNSQLLWKLMDFGLLSE